MSKDELRKQILVRMITEHDGDIQSINLAEIRRAAEEEAQETEQREQRRRLAEREKEIGELLDLAARMEQVTHDDEASFVQLREQACRTLFLRLTERQQDSILKAQQALGSQAKTFMDRPNWTKQRKTELDQSVKRGNSGIYGMRLRRRDGSKDPGKYAGKVCLITRHGWNPVVIPGGIEKFLKEHALWEKYRDKLPRNSKQVPFRKTDRFDIEWIRLADGTRSLVKVTS